MRFRDRFWRLMRGWLPRYSRARPEVRTLAEKSKKKENRYSYLVPGLQYAGMFSELVCRELRRELRKASELGKKFLGPEDQLKRACRGRCEGTNGFLMMSNRRLLFVQEKGFLRKTYNSVLDIPYEKINKIVHEGHYQLTITEVGGRKHNIKTELLSSTIRRILKDLIASE